MLSLHEPVGLDHQQTHANHELVRHLVELCESAPAIDVQVKLALEVPSVVDLSHNGHDQLGDLPAFVFVRQLVDRVVDVASEVKQRVHHDGVRRGLGAVDKFPQDEFGDDDLVLFRQKVNYGKKITHGQNLEEILRAVDNLSYHVLEIPVQLAIIDHLVPLHVLDNVL